MAFLGKVDLAHACSLLRSGLFSDRRWNWKYIYVTRRDLLMQAISYHTAMQTGLWSSLSESDRLPIFDQEMITGCMLTLSNFMCRWECIFQLFRIEPIRIQYEQIAADGFSVVQRCLRTLDISFDSLHLPIICAFDKQRNTYAKNWSALIIESAREYRSSRVGCHQSATRK
jgi:LPS sulfotransferase NodH